MRALVIHESLCGNTHAIADAIHGMSRPLTRNIGLKAATKPDSGVTLDPAADGPGIRDWLGWLGQMHGKAAVAFDTRLKGAALFIGHASAGTAHGLRRHGFQLVAPNASFLIGDENRLIAGELERARAWAATLVAAAGP